MPRLVEVPLKEKALGSGGASIGRDKADPAVLGSVGAPMAGSIVDVIAKPGAQFNNHKRTVPRTVTCAIANVGPAVMGEPPARPMAALTTSSPSPVRAVRFPLRWNNMLQRGSWLML